jgi:hypothetical protein
VHYGRAEKGNAHPSVKIPTFFGPIFLTPCDHTYLMSVEVRFVTGEVVVEFRHVCAGTKSLVSSGEVIVSCESQCTYRVCSVIIVRVSTNLQ